MDSLKILVPYPSFFDDVSNTNIFFKKLLPILNKRSKVTILWLNYQPEKLTKLPKTDSFVTLDIHNYKNALDVLKKEKPDLIFAPPYEGFIDMSFSFAGKISKIPVFTLLYYDLSSGIQDKLSKTSLIGSYLKRISRDTVPSETHQFKKTKFRRGKFIFFKFQFFVKTLFSLKFNFFKIIRILLMVLKFYLSPQTNVDPRLAVDMHFVQNESIKNNLQKSGISPSTIKVTGYPLFDDLIQEISSITPKISKSSSNKVRILLAPISFYEYGDWTKEQRDFILREIVSEINKENNFSLIVKIHPSAALLHEYEKIVHSIDPNIRVIQQGSVEDYFADTDVFISYTSWSTSTMYAIFHGIPTIICNFFGFKSDEMINRGLVLECKESSNLNNQLYQIVKENPATKEKIDAYVDDFFYRSNGNSTQRISDGLFELLKNNKT